MFQKWRDLLFLHWRFEREEIQKKLPAALVPDLFQGQAWVGIVPFRMCDVRPVGLPCVPLLSNFLELNLRTYVVGPDGVAGVWFFSLDCNCLPAVNIARSLFHLNYQFSEMHTHCGLARLESHCRRKQDREFASYLWEQPIQAAPAAAGSLEEFLVERYVLYSVAKDGSLRRGRVAHLPYRIAPVQTQLADSTPFLWNGFAAPARPADHTLASPGVAVKIFPLRKVIVPIGRD